ncbi:flagellar basal-body MS-ring/collar protein FliF [Sporosarcina sp. FA9]|uniref:flagellar basal-body MS-ring/collar protein FliF n=1 Tax=Sporosarcina sp. FA9 TaxID=3413030 RepID=UPI003F65E8F7
MNERFAKIKTDFGLFWTSRTKKQKNTYIISLVGIVAIAAFLTFFLSKTEFVPLYQEVSSAEIGRIKEQLDSQGVPNRIEAGGSSILVPKARVNDLLVTLAAQGFPTSGTTDYTIFSENAGFGMTDNEFNIMKLAATQTELANLIKSIEGIKDANVMITMPTQSVFLNDSVQKATAAIILKTNPGHQFTEPQITALYTLVSKALPNLATEDISIRNQYLEYFDMKVNNGANGTSITEQMAVKKTIERDLQRQVQMMLGTMMGQDKVIVSVTTDVDFKLENREESLVTPVDVENMEGIALSVQRITESFTGNAPSVGGTPTGEDPTDNGTGSYVEGQFQNGDYEKIEETINNEVNRIRKEIVESPYKIRDIGIQVMVEPPVADDITSMPEGVQVDIERILATIIRTSIDKEAAGELSEIEIGERIVVSVQPFNGKQAEFQPIGSIIPWWIYVIGGVLLLVIIGLVIGLVRKRRQTEEDEQEIILEEQELLTIDEINTEQETEGTLRRKQLEKLAKEKPEEFAKLLRTWIAEE